MNEDHVKPAKVRILKVYHDYITTQLKTREYSLSSHHGRGRTKVRRKMLWEREGMPRLVTPLDPNTKRWKMESHSKFPRDQAYIPISSTQKMIIQKKFAFREVKQTYDSGSSEERPNMHHKGNELSRIITRISRSWII